VAAGAQFVDGANTVDFRTETEQWWDSPDSTRFIPILGEALTQLPDTQPPFMRLTPGGCALSFQARSFGGDIPSTIEIWISLSWNTRNTRAI
jgi:hypothetical protein